MNARIPKTDHPLVTEFVERYNPETHKWREISDDSQALATVQLTEFDDVMDAVASEEKRGWQEDYVVENASSEAVYEATRIGMYLAGNRDARLVAKLAERGYKI